MPDPLTTQLVNGAWDGISQAVTEGLGRGSQKNLSDVVPVDQKTLTVSGWQDSRAESLGGGTSQVRSLVGSPSTLDFLHRFHLDYDALRTPPLSGIKAWAAAARLLELKRVVEHLVMAATPQRCRPADLRTLPLDGWGQPRCVSFTPVPGAVAIPSLSPLGWDGPVSIDLPSPRADLQLLVFRVGGGPYVQRPADLALSWVAAGDIGVDVVLTEQLKIINALPATANLPATVAAVVLDPAGRQQAG
jgi:hypothetical protein